MPNFDDLKVKCTDNARQLWKEASYITSLLLYSATVSTLASGLLWIIENNTNGAGLLYHDALFMAVSAYTASGLATVDYTKWSTASIVTMAIVMQLGNIVLLTTLPSVIKIRAMKKEKRKLKDARAAALAGDTEFIAKVDEAMKSLNEDRTIYRLIVVVCGTYWFFVQLLFALLLLPSMSFGWSLFMSMSCFNNAGFSLSPNSFADWIGDMYAVTVFVLLMPLGNTLFPVFFRLMIWLLFKASKSLRFFDSDRRVLGIPMRDWKVAIKKFLRHPRKYYTHMFGRHDTLVLFIFWCIFTLIEFVLFIPEYDTAIFPSNTTTTHQTAVAAFQTVTVRTSGFTILNLNVFRTGHLSFWILSMYVSAYPFIISTRISSNREDDEASENAAAYKNQAVSVIGRDLVWLYLAVVTISFIEDHRVGSHEDPSGFLRVCFEISSAFGNVGLSLPQPGTSGISYSGSLAILSKIILGLTMWAGKHRGLPPAVDKSVLIHGSDLVNIDLPNAEALCRESPRNFGALDELTSQATTESVAAQIRRKASTSVSTDPHNADNAAPLLEDADVDAEGADVMLKELAAIHSGTNSQNGSFQREYSTPEVPIEIENGNHSEDMNGERLDASPDPHV